MGPCVDVTEMFDVYTDDKIVLYPTFGSEHYVPQDDGAGYSGI